MTPYWGTSSHTSFGGFVTFLKGAQRDYNYWNLNDFSWRSSKEYDYWGARLEAVFIAPETGNYVFHLTANDFAALHIHDCLTCAGYKSVSTANGSPGFIST